MKLKEKTTTQLIDIILRKDDVELKLNEQIKTLQKENNRLTNELNKMKIITQIMSIFLFLAIAVSVALIFLSCNTPKQEELMEEVMEDNAPPVLPEHF